MRIGIIAITKNGSALARKLERGLGGAHAMQRYTLRKYAAEGDTPFDSLAELTAKIFPECDALIFICACGIAVRMIAPHLVSKTSDPAVVVIDEQGKYAVSLLSGHLGGANALARAASAAIGAEPVITTATDASGRFSPDLYAQAHDLWITDLVMAKEIAAASVAGEQVGYCSEYPGWEVPEGLVQCTPCDEVNRDWGSAGCTDSASVRGNAEIAYGVYIGTQPERSPFPRTLVLQPRNLSLGIGCRRGIAAQELEQFVRTVFEQNNLPIQRISRIVSIDRKKDEPEIIALAEKFGVPFVTYSADALQNVAGDFTHSDFVEQTVGVDNVCERSAMAEGGELIVPKQTTPGMTLAVVKLPME